jgi:tripeptide aminopeptidase
LSDINTRAAAMPEPDLERALDLVMELMRIPGDSCHEGPIAALVRSKLLAAGVPSDAIFSDDAHRQSPAGGDTGNLIVKLSGTFRAPRRLLMAHLDTVPICLGANPERRGNYIETANPAAGLGADNRSGVATILRAVLEIFERKLPYPPLTLLFTVQE